MSAFNRKTPILKGSAIKLGVVLIFTLLGSFFVVRGVSATSGVADSFDSYNLGDLTGQGGWLVSGDFSALEVNDIRAESGNQSVRSTWINGNNRIISLTEQGTLSFYFMTSSTFAGVVDFAMGVPLQAGNFIWITPSDIYIGDSDNPTKLLLKNNYSYNNWHRISMNYNITEGWWHVRYDFENWSATTTFVGLTPTHLYLDIIGGSNFYIDSIRDEGECNSTCYECDLTSCQNYSEVCNWNYSESFCSPIAENNACGEGWLCSFCTATSTCEAQGCYWYADDNYCWETAPPELPAIEDCSGYDLLPRITCDIKNFFYRLFVPSSPKITELKNTFNLVKEKFPYNYILTTKDFFVSLKGKLSDEDIQFGVLGVSGIIDFSFWNSTTTIGNGGVQKYLDIFKTFSTFIILFVFVIWAIHYLRKIFK